MTALGKLFRTTTFKLTLVYLTVFALFAVFLLGYFALNTRRLITEQITDTVNDEVSNLAELRKLSEGATEHDLLDAYRNLVVEDIRAATAFAADTLAHEETIILDSSQKVA